MLCGAGHSTKAATGYPAVLHQGDLEKGFSKPAPVDSGTPQLPAPLPPPTRDVAFRDGATTRFGRADAASLTGDSSV